MQALTTAAAGMQAAFQRADASAARTARFGATSEDVDLASEVVEQISAKSELKANVAVARTADEMLGAVLDIKA
ncbi:MAG: flagellar hook protein FlgE [Proteobacteria bacterium]|nr:flagellar hook protein FlgE [Pseudomonadota bacterium]